LSQSNDSIHSRNCRYYQILSLI